MAIAYRRPIKSYTQIAKLIICLLAVVVGFSIILGKSLWALLTGIGAMTAIILLVFKDILLGFTACIQLTSHDMVCIGDWITMPNYGADDNVIEIALSAVKIRNFDKTMVTIPTYALLSSTAKNWRGMQETGVRRIKRAVHINMEHLAFCDETLLKQLKPHIDFFAR